jgi:hypothetical protein
MPILWMTLSLRVYLSANLKSAGELSFRRGFRNERRVDVKCKMFRTTFERSLMLEPGRQHANTSPRLRAARSDAARGNQLTFATIRQRKQHNVFVVLVCRQFAAAAARNVPTGCRPTQLYAYAQQPAPN